MKYLIPRGMLIALFGAALLFIFVTMVVVSRETPLAFDAWVHGERELVEYEGLTRVTTVLTTAVNLFAVQLGVGLAVWWYLRRRLVAHALVVAMGVEGALAWQYVVKQIMARPRPSFTLMTETGFSFPSGHATLAAAVAVLMIVMVIPQIRFRYRRLLLTILVIVTAILVGVSRVYLGVHWASDVLGGWTLGTAWVLAVVAVFSRELGRSGQGA